MSDVDLKVGSFDDCPCAADVQVSETRRGDVQMRFMPKRPPKPRKKRSKGKGSFCVLSHKGRVVHCYESEATANRVAKAFTSRGRAGTSFHVEKKR